MLFSEEIKDKILEHEPVPDDETLHNRLIIKPFEVEERPLPERIRNILETHPGFSRIKNGVSLAVAYGFSEKPYYETVPTDDWTSMQDLVCSQADEEPRCTETEYHMTLVLGIKGYFAWTYVDNTITVDDSGIARVSTVQNHYNRTEQEDFRKSHFVDLRRGLVDQKNPRKGYKEDVVAAKALTEMILPRREDYQTEDDFAEDLILALCL